MTDYYNDYLGGKEAMLDLLYLSIHNLVPFGNLPYQIESLSYNYPMSVPPDNYYLVPDCKTLTLIGGMGLIELLLSFQTRQRKVT